MKNRAIKTNKLTKDLALRRCISSIDIAARNGVMEKTFWERPDTLSRTTSQASLASYEDIALSATTLQSLGYVITLAIAEVYERPVPFLGIGSTSVRIGEDSIKISWDNNETE